MKSDKYTTNKSTFSKTGSSKYKKTEGSGSSFKKPNTGKGSYGRTSKGSSSSKPTGYKRVEREKQLPSDPAEVVALLGKVSALKIAKLTPIGAYLSVADLETYPDLKSHEILLPKNEFAGKELRRGEILEAFVYLDSEDRPIATLKAPVLSMGELAVLTCSETTQMGAFLDWGLMKELFLPFKEQTYRIKKGDKALVTLYIDKSSRLCASMKIYKLLSTESPYKANDHVEGLVYELSNEHGAYVAVDNKYSGLITNRDLIKSVKVGEQLQLRVSKVLPDGKLELAMREQSHLQLSDDCDRIYNELKASTKGFLPYHDKTESLIIKNKFNMSKIAFKRAIGHLYKQGLIEIKDDGIRLLS